MRHLLAVFLVLSFLATPAWAQNEDASVYEVADVAVDVTADSAAHARDQAIGEAQHSALSQLLDRLGADPTIATKLSNDDIATLVQSFEVQSERTSAVRYIGTFTVQFRPNAVRNYLGKRNASFTETQGKPVVVLPVFVNNTHAILWEEKTKWRSAWESDAHSHGLVPVVVPSGALPDVTVINTADALKGKSDAIKAMIDRYQTDGAVVATLDTDLDKPGKEFKVSVEQYDVDGDALPEINFTLPAATDKPTLDNTLIQAVKQVRHQLDKSWREAAASGAKSTADPQTFSDTSTSVNASDPTTTHLPVEVAIQTLPEWAQIKRKLESIPTIARVDVIVLQRVSTSIEIEYRGDIEALQLALMQQDLILKQDSVNHVWALQQSPSSTPH